MGGSEMLAVSAGACGSSRGMLGCRKGCFAERSAFRKTAKIAVSVNVLRRKSWSTKAVFPLSLAALC